MSDMPTLGAPEKKQPPIAQVAVIAAVVGVVAGLGYWLSHRAEPVALVSQAEAAPAPVEAVAPAAEVTPTAGVPTPPVVPTVAANAVVPSAAPAPKARADGLRTFSATINGPLETAIVTEVGRDVGGPLTQVVNRSLVWWVKVPGDLLKGDTLSAVYEERDGQEPVVHAVRYTSRKFGKTFEAYRFQPSSAAHPAFFQLDGTTLEEQLSDPPLDDYEQITSLLRDGRKHKGVDFKAPVGTPVRATFDGVVTRKNWNFRGNGNSLEIEETGGQHRTALFLHLSEVSKEVQAGMHVKRGQLVAKSGNTGRSFAPHLHYQLMRDGTVIDPFQSHQTSRATLPGDQRPGFDAAVAKLRASMPGDAVAGN